MSDATTETDDAPEAAPAEPERRFGELLTTYRGQDTIHLDRSGLVAVIKRLRDAEGFNVCLDVTAIDYLTYTSPRTLPDGVVGERFEVVVNLISHANRERLRVKVQVPEADAVVPSLFNVHPGTEAMEREVYDMFGIRFTDHPDLTRILMPEDWEGHPLRKDYGLGRIPVQFKGVVSER